MVRPQQGNRILSLLAAARPCRDGTDDMELITEARADGIHQMIFAGRMDGAGTEQVAAGVAAVIATRPPRVVVDLRQVVFLSSVGIRLLLSTAKSLNQHGGRMAIAGPQPMVREVLDIVGIASVIPVHGDVESACVALAGTD